MLWGYRIWELFGLIVRFNLSLSQLPEIYLTTKDSLCMCVICICVFMYTCTYVHKVASSVILYLIIEAGSLTEP